MGEPKTEWNRQPPSIANLDEIIDAAKQFPPLNPTVVKLSSMIVDPNVGLSEMSTLISYDQALTVELLKAANSAYVGRAMRVTSVQEAISFLGEFKTLNLLLSCTVGSHLRSLKLLVYNLLENQLWRDSVLASITAEQCSKVFRVHAPQVSTTSALLHNVGKVVMSRFMNAEIQEYLSICKMSGKDQVEAEMEILSVHYGEIGGIIAQNWGLPFEITVGISFQHDPNIVKNVTSDVTHVCYRMADFLSQDPEASNCGHMIDPSVIERLKPSSKRWFEVLFELVKDRYQKVCRSYQLCESNSIPANWDWQVEDSLIQSKDVIEV
jgi:HD-like signal output (HDOD) protein